MYRKISVTALIIFFFGLTTFNYAIAGEKQTIKARGTSFMVKFESINVGDDEGHTIGIFEQKVVYPGETADEGLIERIVGFIDINPVTGSGSLQGYGVITDKDGDKMYSTSKGVVVGRDQFKGEWTQVKGTGKFEGAKGGGTWFSYRLDEQVGIIEVEGETEMPGP